MVILKPGYYKLNFPERIKEYTYRGTLPHTFKNGDIIYVKGFIKCPLYDNLAEKCDCQGYAQTEFGNLCLSWDTGDRKTVFQRVDDLEDRIVEEEKEKEPLYRLIRL